MTSIGTIIGRTEGFCVPRYVGDTGKLHPMEIPKGLVKIPLNIEAINIKKAQLDFSKNIFDSIEEISLLKHTSTLAVKITWYDANNPSGKKIQTVQAIPPDLIEAIRNTPPELIFGLKMMISGPLDLDNPECESSFIATIPQHIIEEIRGEKLATQIETPPEEINISNQNDKDKEKKPFSSVIFYTKLFIIAELVGIVTLYDLYRHDPATESVNKANIKTPPAIVRNDSDELNKMIVSTVLDIAKNGYNNILVEIPENIKIDWEAILNKTFDKNRNIMLSIRAIPKNGVPSLTREEALLQNKKYEILPGRIIIIGSKNK